VPSKNYPNKRTEKNNMIPSIFNDRQTQERYMHFIEQMDKAQVRTFANAISKLREEKNAPVSQGDLLDVLHEMNQEALV